MPTFLNKALSVIRSCTITLMSLGKIYLNKFFALLLFIRKQLQRIPQAVRPWHIGFTYIGSIFVFAYFFWLWPNDFHHQVASNDQAIMEQSDEVSQLILSHFKETFMREHSGHEYTNTNGWSINVSSVTSKSLTASNGTLHMQMGMYFFNYTQKPIEMLSLNPVISWEIGEVSEDVVGLDSKYYVKHAKISGVLGSPIPMTVLFPKTSDANSSEIIFIPSSSTLKKMIDFNYASNGLIEHMNRSYLRMLYLSAATITTLGYGDIVPTTDRARVLVGLEAVFGILLAGLFLNAVSNKRNSADEKL